MTEIFKEILKKLGDMHVSMNCGDVRLESAKPTKSDIHWKKEFQNLSGNELLFSGMESLFNLACERILKGNFKKGAGDLLYWGKLDHNIGYLCIGLMTGYAGFEEEDPDVHFKFFQPQWMKCLRT